MPRPSRTNSSSPSSLRSAATATDTAGSVTPSSAAAALTEPRRATSTNDCSWARVICGWPKRSLNSQLRASPARQQNARHGEKALVPPAAAARPQGPQAKGLVQVPAPFEYERATSVEHALELLRQLGPEARILAGGHSLLPMMKLRLATPGYLIDIDGLAGELGYIRDRPGRRDPHRRHDPPPRAARVAAAGRAGGDLHRRRARDRRSRSSATAARSAARCARPTRPRTSARCARRSAPRWSIRGLDGERVLDIDEFHRGPYQTAVEDDEMLVEIRVPLRPTVRQRL